MAESCRQHVEFDMLVKNRTQGIIPLAPISKSLWTCSVESSMEYCRIMYDIFPFKKLVNFIVSDSGAHVLNSWTQEDQNLQELMAALAAVGPPNPRQIQSAAAFCMVLLPQWKLSAKLPNTNMRLVLYSWRMQNVLEIEDE